tara:strand:- start:3682 stop:3963 length:282 start_codon:yes stop_codon:yes gene_type:complete
MSRVTSKTIRPDYKKRPAITVAEAADWSGLSFHTVRAYHSELVDVGRRSRRLRWNTGNAAGPYKIDAWSFRQWLKTGEPHGLTAVEMRQGKIA